MILSDYMILIDWCFYINWTDNVQLIYKVTTPKIIFCDVENYEIAAEVSRNLNLNAPVYLMNGIIKGVGNILELVKVKTGIRHDTFE